MLHKYKSYILTPTALGFMLAKPSFGTWSAFVLLFASLGLLLGSDPIEILENLVIPSITATMPVAVSLVVIWLLYLISYIYTTYPIRTASLMIKRAESYLWTQVIRYASVLRFQSIPLVLQPESRLSISVRRRGIPEHLATGWEASTHPQTE